MKICVKGETMGEFIWTLPEELIDSFNKFIKELPENERAKVEKMFFSHAEKMLEKFVLLETLAMLKITKLNMEYTDRISFYLAKMQLDVRQMIIIDQVLNPSPSDEDVQ